MTVDVKLKQQVTATLERYCRTFDEAQFEEFAALFGRGRWFMVTEPGPAPVLEWINHHVVLYDSRPLTRHEITGLVITVADPADGTARFRCGVTIRQQLPGEPEHLLARARFRGTFRHFDDGWWWHEHAMDVEQAGDLTSHIRDGLAAVVPPRS